METRKFNSEIRAGQSQGDELVLVGRAVTYGAVSGAIPKQFGGYFREVVKPGAFAQSLKNDDQTADWNHDDHKLPLGRKSAGTLQLSDSDTGLNFRIQLDPRQPEHIALHSSVKRGDVRSCSWAFVPNDGGEQWSTAKDENGEENT